MVLIFDLDDTLYPERSYVESGLREVACFGHERFGWETETSFRFLVRELDRHGRGEIFDRWLAAHGKYRKTLARECIKIYRHHRPQLFLYPEASLLLPRLQHWPLYLVTDGHKTVQQLKIEALGITPFFRKILVSRRYGLKNEKPSTYCFDRIRQWEACEWSEMVYVGDNPAKDFVNLNRVGMHTVRVLTGIHRDVKARAGYGAQRTIPDLGKFFAILPHLKRVPP